MELKSLRSHTLNVLICGNAGYKYFNEIEIIMPWDKLRIIGHFLCLKIFKVFLNDSSNVSWGYHTYLEYLTPVEEVFVALAICFTYPYVGVVFFCFLDQLAGSSDSAPEYCVNN